MGDDPIRELRSKPIVIAPMGGGPSTPALVIAGAQAGALGFLAGGYKTPDELGAEINAVRGASDAPFGVNLFLPGSPAEDQSALSAYIQSLAADAAALDAQLGQPAWEEDRWQAKLKLLLTDPPAIVSFTFGCPEREIVDALQSKGSVVAVTVTTPREAQIAARGGADCLCVQGFEAGAHRGSFTNDDRPGQDYGLLALIACVKRVTDLPLIAAGGISGARGVAAVLTAGAGWAQLGTAFLRCPESAASDPYKAALADPRFSATTLTRAFSGRWARSIVNRFVLDHPDAPAAYPEINNATRPLRARANELADTDHMSLYAGQGFRLACDRPAGEIVENLSAGLARIQAGI